jgi:hypothetical protein
MHGEQHPGVAQCDALIAYVRMPSRGPHWPWHDRAALQGLLGQMLMGQRSGRRHLPAALAAAGPGGLPVLLIRDGVVKAAARMVQIGPGGLSLVSDDDLAQQLLGALVPMLPGMTVQIHRRVPPTPPPPPRRDLPRPRPPPPPVGNFEQYTWTMAAMDDPPPT